MTLGIWKKMAALLSVICISVVLNGCGPAAETPAAGSAAGANSSEEADDAEASEESEADGTEDEGSTALD